MLRKKSHTRSHIVIKTIPQGEIMIKLIRQTFLAFLFIGFSLSIAFANDPFSSTLETFKDDLILDFEAQDLEGRDDTFFSFEKPFIPFVPETQIDSFDLLEEQGDWGVYVEGGYLDIPRGEVTGGGLYFRYNW